MRRMILLLTLIQVFLFTNASFAATYKDLEIWTLLTLADISLILVVLGLVLHLAEAYYERTLGSFRLRLSGEHWGLVFLVVRDGSLFLTFAIGLLFINPDIMADIKLAVPFYPLATAILGWALIVKVAKDIHNDARAAKLFLSLLTLSVLLYFFGYTFVMEAAPEEWLPHVAPFWGGLRNLRSNANPGLAMFTFYTCFPLILSALIGLILTGAKGMVKIAQAPEK